MNATEPSPRRRLFAVALSLALLGGFAAGFMTSMPGLVPLVAVPVVILCAFVAGYAMLKLRPSSTSLLAAPIAVLVVTGLSVFGSGSLWLTMFGEHEKGCEVVSVNTHTSRKSPDSYSNDLMCRSRRVADHFPDGGQDELRKPGDRVDLVVDVTGMVRVREPSGVTWWRSLFAPAAAVSGVAFVVVVLRLPRWKPRKGTSGRKTQLNSDFL